MLITYINYIIMLIVIILLVTPYMFKRNKNTDEKTNKTKKA